MRRRVGARAASVSVPGRTCAPSFAVAPVVRPRSLRRAVARRAMHGAVPLSLPPSPLAGARGGPAYLWFASGAASAQRRHGRPYMIYCSDKGRAARHRERQRHDAMRATVVGMTDAAPKAVSRRTERGGRMQRVCASTCLSRSFPSRSRACLLILPACPFTAGKGRLGTLRGIANESARALAGDLAAPSPPSPLLRERTARRVQAPPIGRWGQAESSDCVLRSRAML